MKLLKKIAPFAISALMIGATLGGAAALNIADWHTQFKADSTAVVLGNGVTDVNDIAAAMNVAKQVGIDTTSTSVSGENYPFAKTSDKLNVGDSLTDIRTNIGKDQLPVTLADGTYKDIDNNEYKFTQKVTMQAGLKLEHFANSDYDNKAPTLGIDLARNAPVLDYVADFSDTPDFGASMEATTINLMGKDYYVINVAGADTVDLLDAGTSGEVIEGTSATIGGKTIEIVYVTDTPKVKLKVGTETTTALAIGGTYKLNDGTYVGIKDAFYNGKDTGKSEATVTVGTGKIELVDGEAVSVNGDAVDGLTSVVTVNAGKLEALGVDWAVDDKSFITSDSSITMPTFGSLKLMSTGMTFPAGETIEYGVDGDSTAMLTVPITDGTAEIPLLYDDGTNGDFNYIGGEDQKLVTTTNTNIVFDDDLNDKYFVISGNTTSDAATYFLEPSGWGTSSGDRVVSIKNAVKGATNTYCTDMKTDSECDIGDLTLTFNEVNATAFKVTLTGDGASFNRLYTAKGATMWLPQSSDTSIDGYWNVTTGYGKETWGLKLAEANKDGDLAGGEDMTITYGFTDTDNLVKVATIAASDGGDMLKVDSDHYVGYVTSDLATKIEEDKTADQWVATATYYGGEVYGNVQLAGTGASSGSSSWTPVKDSETDKFVSKNIVVIGGTAVNAVARKMLGLGTDPVYGNEAGWTSNTNVDASGKGILWMKTSPYTEGTGKYALLVAGYLGPDTEKSANFLQLKGSTVTKDKVVIDTNALVEAS
jgi:hypothetical protein